MSIFAEAAVSFWAVIMHNLNGSSNPLWIFFLQGWAQTKSRLIYWIRETSSLVTLHCLRKWTSMNDQCQISLIPVHFCNSCMSVCMRPLNRTFTLELYQETHCQKLLYTWNLRSMFQFRLDVFYVLRSTMLINVIKTEKKKISLGNVCVLFLSP